MKFPGLVVLIFSGLGAPPATGQNAFTAGDLLHVCTIPEMHWVDFCNGYFQAAHDVLAIADKACVPAGVTRTELVELFQVEATLRIGSDPTYENMPAISAAGEIMQTEFPCE